MNSNRENRESERGDGNTRIIASPSENTFIEDLESKSTSSIGNKKQDTQSRYWCFTWNNYTEIETLQQILNAECTWYIFQEETGENGTPHLQGTVYLQKTQRLTSLKKLCPAIHWEKTRSVKASIEYCTKYQSRTGKVYSKGIDIPRQPKCPEVYGWQLQVLEILKDEPDNRTIHWFYDEYGGVGKSALTKYLYLKHNAVVVSGKANDMFHMLSKAKDIKVVVIDIPRSANGFISYGGIEAIKNGIVFSGKYDSTTLCFDTPHVICFANEPPDTTKFSEDRWHIVNIRYLMKTLAN